MSTENKSRKQIVEDLKFTFTPQFKILESGSDTKGKWCKIGGTALTEGISTNKNKYTVQNLVENDGRKFKWLVGHPKDLIEKHVVGTGQLTISGSELLHEGKIRNTAMHPDIVESVQDGFVGPSIQAFAKRVTREGSHYNIEGLEVDFIGFVASQGVKDASIDYAIAESFDRTESSEAREEEEGDAQDNKKTEESSMTEKTDVKESVSVEEFKKVQEALDTQKAEISRLTEARKKDLASQVMEINKDLKEEDLLKESESQLSMRVDYEKRLAEKGAKSQSVTEEDGEGKEAEGDDDKGEGEAEGEKAEGEAEAKDLKEARDGNVCTLNESAYRKFNADMRARVR